jgi:chromosome segregation ATPase
MADYNSKALIEALKEVIRDFNTKINEQFGDNFKQLNSAVAKILLWQEAYRQQMAEMIDQQRATTENMSTAAARYSELVQQAERFSNIAAELKKLLTDLDMQRQHLHEALTHLGNLLKAAGDSVPRLEEKMIEMTRQIEAGVRNTTQQVQASQAKMEKVLTENAENVHREVASHVKQLSERTREQVMALDRALSEELTKSITTLGKQLTALSAKFVEDYTPLTESLRSVVQMARGV